MGSTFFHNRTIVFDSDKLRVGVVGLSSLVQSQNRVIDYLSVAVSILLFMSLAFVASQELIKLYLKQREINGSGSETDDDYFRATDI